MKKNQYLQISAAAEFLKVTAQTLRNWDKGGKLKPRRNPMSGYRIYKKTDLVKLQERIEE